MELVARIEYLSLLVNETDPLNVKDPAPYEAWFNEEQERLMGDNLGRAAEVALARAHAMRDLDVQPIEVIGVCHALREAQRMLGTRLGGAGVLSQLTKGNLLGPCYDYQVGRLIGRALTEIEPREKRAWEEFRSDVRCDQHDRERVFGVLLQGIPRRFYDKLFGDDPYAKPQSDRPPTKGCWHFVSSPPETVLRILNYIPDESNVRVLDLGSGPGAFVLPAALCRRGSFVGVELDKSLVTRGRAMIERSGLQGTAFKEENVLETDLSQATHLYIYSPLRDRGLMRELVDRIGSEASQRALTVIAGYDPFVGELRRCQELQELGEECHRAVFVSKQYGTV
jgi:hypothetical protein